MFTVKAYLSLQDSVEVRRFVLDSVYEVNYQNRMSFVTFHKKLEMMFPVLANKQFAVTWTDEENDVITMSSDEELHQAIDHANNTNASVLKVNLTITCAPKVVVHLSSEAKASAAASVSTSTVPESSKPKELENHPFVVCDACNENIKGYRFKCLECEDYDLCAPCFAKDIHPDHDMLKIVSSAKLMQSGRWFLPMRHIWHKLGRRAIHFQEKAAHLQEKAELKRTKSDAREYKQRFRATKEVPEKYHQTLADETHVDGSQTNKIKSTDKRTHERYTRFSSQDQGGSQFLRCLGETVADLLDPLGINVTVDVENSDGEIEQVANNKSEPTPRGATASAASASDTPIMTPTVVDEDKNKKTEEDSKKSEEISNAEKSTKPKEPKSNRFVTFETPEPFPENNGWTMINPSSSFIPTSAPSKEAMRQMFASGPVECCSSSSSENSFPPSFTRRNRATFESPLENLKVSPPLSTSVPLIPVPVVQVPPVSTTSDGANAVAPDRKAAPSVPASAAETMKPLLTTSLYPKLNTLTPEVSNALAQMINMGYTNEGGWLSALLNSKNGDIASVLDILHPNCMQN